MSTQDTVGYKRRRTHLAGKDGKEGRDDGVEKSVDLKADMKLRAKAELYDKIAMGENPLDAQMMSGSIDFHAKKKITNDLNKYEYGDEHTSHGNVFQEEYQDRKQTENYVEKKVEELVSLSSGARVKTQWEKTMSHETKTFLDEFRKESASEGARVHDKAKSAKELRRQLVLEKLKEVASKTEK
jgi:hypothetical protein